MQFSCSIHGVAFHKHCKNCDSTRTKEISHKGVLPENFKVIDGKIFRKRNGKFQQSDECEIVINRYMPVWYARFGNFPDWW
jgi:hypothetical protein